MRFYIFFLMGFFSLSLPLYAKKYEYSGDCTSSKNIQNLEDCLDKELALYDKELNILYKHLLEPSDDHLKEVEKLWVKFKEADCKYMAYEVNEGKEFQFIEKVCLINKTKARIVDLKRSYFSSDWFDR